MKLKRWILANVNRMNGVVGRPDLPQREPTLRGVPEAAPGPEHLGAYAPLVTAIRDELEHFVSSQLRLHLAIAERDRYLLTSIEVECVDGGDGSDLLREFCREFTPEQIKRFLARDIIAHLPNASAIDLSQFGGLNATRARSDVDDEDGFADLRAQLRATTQGAAVQAFDVTLMGRWGEPDASAVRAGAAPAVPRTPLAGSRIEVEIEDADGPRRVALASVVPNRRYSIGKGEGCDIVVNGTFASRRHCEIWLENGAWWAADAGSTNGIRVASMQGVLGRAGAVAGVANAKTAIEIVPGAQVVLSALGKGTTAEYPSVRLLHDEAGRMPSTPLGTAAKSTTPVTPIAMPRLPGLTVTVCMASGERSLGLSDQALPLRIGRSRGQDLVVDWAHAGVSGHHVDIVGIDATGADIEVHGDNGVTVDGVVHSQGQRFRWRVGERMTLGRASGDEPECTLALLARP
jgi:pSer/pThr/pTyr-binding forkhead associated (FHA) protein